MNQNTDHIKYAQIKAANFKMKSLLKNNDIEMQH